MFRLLSSYRCVWGKCVIHSALLMLDFQDPLFTLYLLIYYFYSILDNIFESFSFLSPGSSPSLPTELHYLSLLKTVPKQNKKKHQEA